MAHLPDHSRHTLTELQFSGFESPKLHKQIELAFEEYQIGESDAIQFLIPYQWDARCIQVTHRVLWKSHGYKPSSPFKLDQPKNHQLKFYNAEKKSFDDTKPTVDIIFFQPCVLTAEKKSDCPHCGESKCDAYTYLADIQHSFQYVIESAILLCFRKMIATLYSLHDRGKFVLSPRNSKL